MLTSHPNERRAGRQRGTRKPAARARRTRRRHARSGLWILTVLALATTGWLAPTAGAAPPARAQRANQSPTPAAGQLPGVAPLADCLRSGRPLLTLFLIDTSGSLQQTDPTNQRVAGVKTALEGLASLQATTIGKQAAQIEVQLDGFSVGLNPAPQWTTLTDATLASVDSQADTFASQNTGQDTDYYAALSGARQALANQAATVPSNQTPCKAIFWFTDGQYDVIDRIDAQEAATLGATKAYAPDIDLTMPGGGRALIARGKQLLCEPGGLDDQMRADGIVTVAVAIDTQIAPSDQAFLTAVATGNGCGTPPSTPTGASLETGDLSQLVLSFNAVANGTAGGTQVGGTTTVTPCPGKPCAAGTQRFTIDKTLNRATLLSLASNPGIDMLITAPGSASPLRITAGNSGTESLGSTTVRFAWINAQTCSLELDLGSNAAGQWQIVFIAPATLATPGTVQTQLHVYADITPHLLAAPRLRVGNQGTYDLNIANTRGQAISPTQIRTAHVSATATDPFTGRQQSVDVRTIAPGHYHVLYTPSGQVASITIIQITVLIITLGGIQLAPIQRTFREPVQPPVAYPRLGTSEVNLNTPQGTGGDGALTFTGGTRSACAWIDPAAPTTLTSNTQVNFTQATTERSQCIKIGPGQHRSLPLTVVPTPELPGTIQTSIALHLVVVHLRVIIIIIPLTLTLTSAVLPQNGPIKEIVSLGDSYSSGEGNPPFDIGTDEPFDLCHRSPEAWPSLIGVDPSFLLACSGAQIANLTTNGQTTAAPDNVPQIQRLAQINTQAPVDVVSVMIGGNDLGFSTILGKCYLLQSCLKVPASNDAEVDKIAGQLQNTVLPAVKTAAPSAQIFLVSYPNVLPPSDKQVTGCAWLNSGAYARMTALEAYLLKKEKAAASAAGVHFVDVSQALSDHALCSADPWIHKIDKACIPVIVYGVTAVDPAAAYCGHPLENATQHGQRAIANIVQAAITQALSPPTTTTTTTAPSSEDPTLGAQTDPSQEGFGSVRPNIVSNGGDPTGEALDVQWQSWGGPQAMGTGTSDYVTGDEAVADGTQDPVTIVAYDLGTCDGHPAYLKVAWYFPEHGESFGVGPQFATCGDAGG